MLVGRDRAITKIIFHCLSPYSTVAIYNTRLILKLEYPRGFVGSCIATLSDRLSDFSNTPVTFFCVPSFLRKITVRGLE
jgi:hypothetical protein